MRAAITSALWYPKLLDSSAGLRLIFLANKAIPSDAASLKLCKASAIRERLPEIIPPMT